MVYNKLVILHTANYSRKIRDFFGVDFLIEKGLDVEFWNCGKITVEEHLSPVYSDGLKLVDISSLSDFDKQIKNRAENQCLYLSYINYAFYSYKMFRVLSNNNASILCAAAGIMPIQVVEHNSKNRWNRLRIEGISNLIRGRYYSFKLHSKTFVPMRFLMESCDAARPDYKVSHQTIHLACNSGDYENYVKSQVYVEKENKPYAVFIDQYIPYHNDNVLLGKELMSPAKYYGSLNRYFSEFEKTNSCKVIIAAHPSAVRYKDENPYDGRIIEYNKSAELVKGSICVLAQFSTAISFAVLGYKPVTLLTSDEIESKQEHMRIHIQTFKKMLDCDIQNVDNPTRYVPLPVNRDMYDKYKYTLLTTKQSEGSLNADVIESIVKDNYYNFIR